jgi:hypothetical protein
MHFAVETLVDLLVDLALSLRRAPDPPESKDVP